MTLSDLAIVIPIGPGDSSWRELLDQIVAVAVAQIVLCFADALPADAHPRAASDRRVQMLAAPRGRAAQLNAGAAATQSSMLWFVHADCRLAKDSVNALQRYLGSVTPLDLGYFDLRFSADGPALMALNTCGAWLRCRCFRLPFGDQGFVMSAELFDRLGGFDMSLPGAEDHQLVWRARAMGARVRPVGGALYTSARKYAEYGWWRTTFTHLRLTWIQARAFSRGFRS